MQYDLNVLFVLRKAQLDKKGLVPVYLRITVNGERAELSTGRKVESEKWSGKLQRVVGRSEAARTLNGYLDSLENKVKQNLNILIDKQEEISVTILRDMLTGKHQKEHSLISVFEINNNKIK